MIEENSKNRTSSKVPFKLRFVIKHPGIPKEVISSTLGLVPHHGHSVGEARMTPAGNHLPGNHRETFWGYNPDINENSRFFDAALAFARSISAHADFLNSISKTDGIVGLYIDVLAVKNIGDILKPTDMMLFSSLGITLGIEFFP
ncbi:hypothetical protein [Massilia antarctica]|uniref:hypothetical protein n=1 Tax=Massilia antarctica TaxID=2765360 RepID=UPI0011AF7730|nr:hypothetical protein [Massilia sp. H27-R4]MCY0910406.1 hypothetical protein [Massilia sp. H27-R4]